MIAMLIFSLCLIASVALWHSAFNYEVDAAPVGSIMFVASAVLFVIAVFAFGVAVGQFINS